MRRLERGWESPNSDEGTYTVVLFIHISTLCPPPFGRGGGHTRLRLEGWGSPNSNEGTYTVVLYIYKYFVTRPLERSLMPLPGS